MLKRENYRHYTGLLIKQIEWRVRAFEVFEFRHSRHNGEWPAMGFWRIVLFTFIGFYLWVGHLNYLGGTGIEFAWGGYRYMPRWLSNLSFSVGWSKGGYRGWLLRCDVWRLGRIAFAWHTRSKRRERKIDAQADAEYAELLAAHPEMEVGDVG